ncbi:DUF5572 domain-containing protein [Aspergillus foveolatus]|uniref:DUF5572 domain-containing protein n=1 Tax=Aspergillus foveolatus TaxID=210207 RepID=UPI003CCD5D5B
MPPLSTATDMETSSPHPRGSITAAQTESRNPQADIFEQLNTYPFSTDREFAGGLAIILGHPETPASEEEIARDDDLVLQAKCYYFTRKNNLALPLDVATYKSWLEARRASSASIDGSREIDSSEISASSLSPTTISASKPTSQEPTYPISFAHIVELITTGQPVPGIQHIPDTLLTGQGAASAKPKRLKPWEKGETA